MTKTITDEPNLRKDMNSDNEDMRATVVINEDVSQWEPKAVNRDTLKSDLPSNHVNREPKTQVHGTEYPKIG